MSESKLSERCEVAFPELQNDESKIDINKFLPDSAEFNNALFQKREELTQELGFPSFGSDLFDHAKAANLCIDIVKEEEKKEQAAIDEISNQRYVANTIASAEKVLGQAILEGRNSTALISMEAKIDPTMRGYESYYGKPELNKWQQAIFDGVNKNPLLQAVIKRSEPRSHYFIMEISLKNKE